MAIKKTQTADSQARVTLPKRFAKATVILEHVSKTEVRIRKAAEAGARKAKFAEEAPAALSDRDRDRFLQLLESPPRPNAALRRAMSNRRNHHR